LKRKLKGGVANGSVEAVGNLNPESRRRSDPDQLTLAEPDTTPDSKIGPDPKIGLDPATIN